MLTQMTEEDWAIAVEVFQAVRSKRGHVFLSDAVLQDIGLLSRFLITEPETTMGSRPHRDLTSAHEAAMAAYRAKTLGLLRLCPTTIVARP